MVEHLEAVTAQQFQRLHPKALEQRAQIRRLLERVSRESVTLHRGMNRRVDPETAVLEEVGEEFLVLRTRDFERDHRTQIYLNFELDGRPYFFAAARLSDLASHRLRIRFPSAVYCAERRDRARRIPGPSLSTELHRVLITAASGQAIEAEVRDCSPEGLGIRLASRAAQLGDAEVRLRFLDGPKVGFECGARVCHRDFDPEGPGWTRLGLKLSAGRVEAPLDVDRRTTILDTGRWQRARQGWTILRGSARLTSGRVARSLMRRAPKPPDIRVVDYKNDRGESLVAIVDSWGDTRGAPAVVIPPAWGRTKETLLPVARTIVAVFRAARRPVTVVRFDGIRKRGESHTDPECAFAGREDHRFTFSQGTRDIEATLDFLGASREFRPPTSILVTFSAASIDGRHALARDAAGARRIGGWVSVVGSADLQSLIRVISGGVDFVGGVERGMRFGFQEILGVEVDIDLAGRDAIEHRLAFLEDSRREMRAIDVPITWFHGRYDAWMNLDRVRDVLASGDRSRRRIVELPTGHQIKSSRQALEAFQCVAVEIGRMALGQELPLALPDFRDLEGRQRAERQRRPKRSVDLRRFWRAYLVGSDGSLGIELMTHASAYRGLMREQIRALRLQPGFRVADLGSGTGPFTLQLMETWDRREPLEIHAYDYVGEAHARARERRGASDGPDRLALRFTTCDLSVGSRDRFLPAGSGTYDAVLASLLLSYVGDPEALLREMRRVLRPGGRLVLSTLQRDADISKIFMDGFREMQAGLWRERFGAEATSLEASSRAFLNEAARLLDLEESGAFRFWEAEEFARLVRRAGFRKLEMRSAFGAPAQAIVLSAERS